jgi:hypothetical protein
VIDSPMMCGRIRRQTALLKGPRSVPRRKQGYSIIIIVANQQYIAIAISYCNIIILLYNIILQLLYCNYWYSCNIERNTIYYCNIVLFCINSTSTSNNNHCYFKF